MIGMDPNDSAKTTIQELQRLLLAKNIAGDPIELEDKIVFPISKIGLGFGGSSWRSENKNTKNSSGAGGGIGIIPVAVVIVFKGVEGPEGIRVVPLTNPETQNPLWESLGEISSAFLKGFDDKIDPAKEKHDDSNDIVVEIK